MFKRTTGLRPMTFHTTLMAFWRFILLTIAIFLLFYFLGIPLLVKCVICLFEGFLSTSHSILIIPTTSMPTTIISSIIIKLGSIHFRNDVQLVGWDWWFFSKNWLFYSFTRRQDILVQYASWTYALDITTSRAHLRHEI